MKCSLISWLESTDNSNYEEEVKQLGGKIYVTAPFPKNVIKNWTETKYFFKTHRDYDIVHVHANSLLYLLPLKLAKKYGVKCRDEDIAIIPEVQKRFIIFFIIIIKG